MKRGKRKLTVWLGAILGAALLFTTAFICRHYILEPWYLHRLQSEDPSVRAEAAKRLGQIKSVDAIPLLAEALVKHDQLHTITSVATGKREVYIKPTSISAALVEIGEPAVPALIQLLKHDNPLGRAYAASALRRIGEDANAAVPLLTDLLDDKEKTVAEAAARALADIQRE